uniref:Uncharacterized protein n=1 Tax=Angiostrongylus cantonensis TaxID=6313 RepID=A0A0K0DP97_ANGCA
MTAGGRMILKRAMEENQKLSVCKRLHLDLSAVSTSNGVVAQCGHDRKWHTSSLSMEGVTVHTVDCIKLPLRREQLPARRVANINPDGDEEDGSGDADGAFLHNTHTV